MLSAVSLGRVALSLTLATAILSPLAGATCYYPDGSEASGDTPCGNGTEVACCGKNSICMSNGLCMAVAQPYTLARSSCSDISWQSENCPNYCLDSSTFNSSGISIVLYTYLDSVAEYCCNNIVSEDNDAVCAGNYSRIRIPDGDIMPGYAALADYVLYNETTSSSSNSTNTTSAANNTTSSSSSGSSSNHDAAIGAGVGVPLGVIALASIAWALWERRKLHRLRSEGFAAGAGAGAGAAAVAAAPVEQKPAAVPAAEHVQSPQIPADYTTTPSDNSLYSQQQYAATNANGTAQPPRMLSELGVGGPVELDSRRA